VATIQGFTRFRKHQVGKQTSILTAVPATRVLPYTGAIVINPNRTMPAVDTGSLDPILDPYLGAFDYTANWAGPGATAYNDLPYTAAAALKAGVTPTNAGGAYTWTFQAASLTADNFEYLTDEWGDDQNATDGLQGIGGVINDFSLGFNESIGAWDYNSNLVFANVAQATARTAGLSLDQNPTWLYGGDTTLYLDSNGAGIGSTPMLDDVHSMTWTVNNNLDKKRFANGSNSMTKLAGYGRGNRTVEVKIVRAKSTSSMAERNTLNANPVPNRYFVSQTTSTTNIVGSTKYQNTIYLPLRLMAVADGAIGNNSTIEFTYSGFYDSTLAYAIKWVTICGLSAL
jgi:hypothetical protein